MRGTLLLLASFFLTNSACQKPPSELRIKGPKDAVESTKAVPNFPVFEKKNDTLQLRASSFDAAGVYMGGAKVKWDSSDRSVATVDQAGLVTVLSSGTFEIVASTTETEKPLEARQAFRSVIVDHIRIVAPKVEPGRALKIALGETVQLQAEVLDDRGNVIPDAKITWDCPSPAASVSVTGELEGRAIGSAQIFAEAKNGRKVSWDYEVTDWKK